VAPLLQQLLGVEQATPLVVRAEAPTISVTTAVALAVKVTVVVLVVVGNGHAQVHLQVGAVEAVAVRAQWELMPTRVTTIALVMVAQGWRVHFSPQVLLQL
jgi:hypothetical protein